MFNFNTNNVLAVIAFATIAGPTGIITTALPTETEQKQETEIKKTVTAGDICGVSMLECTNHHMGSLNANLRRMLEQKYPSAKDASNLCTTTMMFKDCLDNIPDCDGNTEVARIISEVNRASENCESLNGKGGVHEHYNGPSEHPHKNNKSIYKYKTTSSSNDDVVVYDDDDKEDNAATSIGTHRYTVVATGVVVAALQILF